MSRDGSLTLPGGGMGLSTVCDCGISWSNSLLFLGSEYPYTFFTWATRLVTLKHGLHHWIVSAYELEMPLTRSHTVLEIDHEIILQ